MPTETLPTRSEPRTRESLSRGFGIALALHGAVAVGLIVAAYIAHNQHSWGDQNPTTGSIQVSSVSTLPLPPRARPVDKEVLATENPTNTPATPPPTPEAKTKSEVKPKTEPVPNPNDIPIPDKVRPKNAKPAEKTQPVGPVHPPVTPPAPTPKVGVGDPGVQIPMSVTNLRNGTSAVTVDDRPFGDRYAYYIALVSRKVNESKAEGDPDPLEAKGKRTIIRFTIQRDGTPTDISVDTRSGSSALDTDTLRAVQRIDSFGPLPAGNHLVIRYIYDSH